MSHLRTQNVSPGRDFVRSAIIRARHNTNEAAVAAARSQWGDRAVATQVTRAAVQAGGPNPGDWGESLIFTEQSSAFFGVVRERSILGQMAGYRTVPLRTRVINAMSGATAFWAGAGKPKPVSKMSLQGEVLEPRKVVGLTVTTDELLRSADPAAEALIESDLVGACSDLLDLSMLDPDNAGVPNETPASLTNGVAPLFGSQNPGTDLVALVGAYRGDLASAVLISDPITLAKMALSRDNSGNWLFPDLGPRGGFVLGNVPVLSTRASPNDSNGAQLVMLDASALAFGGGGVNIDRSENAALQMTDDPTTGATTVVSLWQCDCTAFRIEIECNWSLARPGGVAIIREVTYPTTAAT